MYLLSSINSICDRLLDNDRVEPLESKSIHDALPTDG